MEMYPKSVTKQCHQKILEQMNNSICRIKNKKVIAFFCYIKYTQNKIPVIILNNYINNIEYMNSMIVLINNKEEIIDIDEIIYKDKINNISIIKIKNINNKNIKYIEIDDKIYEKDSEINYHNESVYIIQKIKNDTLVSYGVIKEINTNEIIYSGNVNSNFSLIFNLNNNKLIGLHKNNAKYYYNEGIYFKNIIKEIKNYLININEINILVNIEKEDINKEIYFINDANNDLKQLNEYNTELFINDKKEIYKRYINSEKIGINNIKLKFDYDLKNIENIFNGCEKIILINLINLNTKNITNMKNMFCCCNNLKKINLFSLHITNVRDISYMFYGCKSLKKIPDISEWDTKNVKDMRCIFYGCNSLNNFPDISKLNTQNVEYMNDIFNGCSSLNNLPDISKWDTKNVKNMSGIFSGCCSLNILPDISKWNTESVEEMRFMFYGCSSLTILPDISKWNMKKVKDMIWMFSGCSSLNKLPDISKWNTHNVENMRNLFMSCRSLKYLPDISKWDTQNVKDMRCMFCGCSSLINLPNI